MPLYPAFSFRLSTPASWTSLSQIIFILWCLNSLPSACRFNSDLLTQPTILHCLGIFTRAQLFLTPAALHPVCSPAWKTLFPVSSSLSRTPGLPLPPALHSTLLVFCIWIELCFPSLKPSGNERLWIRVDPCLTRGAVAVFRLCGDSGLTWRAFSSGGESPNTTQVRM